MTIEDVLTISTLLREIQDESLENILRDVLFSNVPVTEALRQHRPNTQHDSELRVPAYK